MIYGSVCSGIEAASVAWHPLGWRAAFLSEIEPFPRAVLQHHYPEVPLHGDFTTIEKEMYEPIDVLVGGTPCQSFSVAGLRGGLDDQRGNLALEFLRLADRLSPEWVVWENVPGVLSSNGGRDFGSILGGLVELGYGFAYRVLDAQFFGVAQRRRRVFVVGCLGDWRRAAAVLFERHSLQGHPAPRRQAGKEAAKCLTRGAKSPTGGGKPLPAVAFNFHKSGNEGSSLGVTEDRTDCLRADSKSPFAVAFDCNSSGQNGFGIGEVAATLRSMGHANSHTNGGGHAAVQYGAAVRRLTPRECERLQGFPDDYTLIPTRKRNWAAEREEMRAYFERTGQSYTDEELDRLAADGPRYKALGNSMAVPVMAHIGRRIELVDGIASMEAAA